MVFLADIRQTKKITHSAAGDVAAAPHGRCIERTREHEMATVGEEQMAANDDAPSSSPATTEAKQVVTTFIKFSLSLPLSDAAFDDEKQAKFKEAIARAAEVPPPDVAIIDIEALSSVRVRVNLSVKAENKAAALGMGARFQPSNIDAELSKVLLYCCRVCVPLCLCARICLIAWSSFASFRTLAEWASTSPPSEDGAGSTRQGAFPESRHSAAAQWQDCHPGCLP